MHPKISTRGYFVRPTVFADVTNDMTIAQEEIFGPVLSIIAYDDEDDAVRIANDTVYGLAGGVWSADPDRAERVARRLRTGQVDINGGCLQPAGSLRGLQAVRQRAGDRALRPGGVPRDQVAPAPDLSPSTAREAGDFGGRGADR